MNTLKSIRKMHMDMIRPNSGVSHKRYIAINSFYCLIMFGMVDLFYDVPEVLYLVFAGLAGLEGGLSLLEKKKYHEKGLIEDDSDEDYGDR